MNCEHLHRVLDAYLDGELDEGTHAQVQTHLAQCAGCAERSAERLALRDGLRQFERHEAPAPLRSAIAAALAREDSGKSERPLPGPTTPTAPVAATARWRTAAWAGASAALAFWLGVWMATPPTPSDLREQVIARHVASFDGNSPRVQVTSTDRHVVKPWFAGKLDFAPPVRDGSAQGFVLVGGRIDTLDGRPAAALVYRIRQHPINLFVARTRDADSSPMHATTRRGFAVVAWAHEGLRFSAVSDVDAAELLRFAQWVQAPSP
jgi:anti-sigma factor RsiW